MATKIQRSRRIPPSEKAAFHQTDGAGKSRVTRQFMGLTAEDETAIVARVEAYLDKTINRTR